MKVLFDTSVLVPAMLERHPNHISAHACLARAAKGSIEMLVSGHSMAECFAVLTAMPLKPKITPAFAVQLIESNLKSAGKIVALSASDHFEVLRTMALLGLSGALIYDALILQAATKSGAGALLTYNVRDFERLNTGSRVRILTPEALAG